MFSKGWILSIPYEFVGCYQKGSLPTLESKARQLDGNYKNRTDKVRKCYEAANERGWSLFTVSDGGACNSGPDAIYTYAAKGEVGCSGSSGGPNKEAAQVYIIPGKQFSS